MPINRLLLDANALLNAVFIGRSWSRRAVDEALKRKVPLVIGENTRAEALEVAQSYAGKLRRELSPRGHIVTRLQFWRVIETPATAQPVPEEVPAHDAHVYREAVTADAIILTSDADLLEGAGDRAISPAELIRQWIPEEPSSYIFGVTPQSERGSIFFRGYPHWSAPPSMPAQFVAAEFDNGARLYYDALRLSWVADLPGIDRLHVPATIEANSPQTVAVSWTAGARAQLRVGSVDHPAVVRMGRHGVRGAFGKASIGATRAGTGHWNGAVNALIIDDRPIGALWHRLRGSLRLTPNPYDSARLEAHIAAALPY